jgi:FMN hydrolase / 5-amino-6-(5-phospho-D-ribitylamino)uracil phosphatase
MTELRLICLDLDDTLWPIEATIRHAEQVFHRALQQLAPSLCAQVNEEEIRQHRLDFLKSRPELRHNISQWRKESLASLLVDTGHGSASNAIAEQAFQRFLIARHQVTLFEHCEEVLGLLRQNYQLIGLTNGNADLARIPAGIHFDAYFRAEEFGISKPHPRLFEEALNFAKCQPNHALHIGDHVDDDIAGAKAAGLFTIQARLVANPPPPSPLADGYFDNWLALPTVIDNLKGKQS